MKLPNVTLTEFTVLLCQAVCNDYVRYIERLNAVGVGFCDLGKSSLIGCDDGVVDPNADHTIRDME